MCHASTENVLVNLMLTGAFLTTEHVTAPVSS